MYLSQGVMLLDKAPQPFLDDVGVDLRGRDVGMEKLTGFLAQECGAR